MLRDPDRFDGWLRRLLVRACYREARRERSRRRVEVHVTADPMGTNEVVIDGLGIQAEPPVWSPDGGSVLVVAQGEDGRSRGLALLDPMGLASPRLIPVEGIDGFGWAAWQRLAP